MIRQDHKDLYNDTREYTWSESITEGDRTENSGRHDRHNCWDSGGRHHQSRMHVPSNEIPLTSLIGCDHDNLI